VNAREGGTKKPPGKVASTMPTMPIIKKSAPLPILLGLMILTIGGLGPPAAGQSQAEIRRENQSLRTRVADLEVEMKALREENERLRKELAQAGQSGGAATGSARPPAPPVPLPVTIDESKPEASPRSLLRSIRESYAKTTADLEMGDDADTSQRTTYLRRLDRWAPRTNREHRLQVDWHVRILSDSVVPYGRRFVLKMEAVDPKPNATLGDPFDAMLSTNLTVRLRNMESRGNRIVAGTFDNPRLIGQFAEFAFDVEAAAINRVPVEKPRKAKAKEKNAAGNPAAPKKKPERAAGAEGGG